MDNIKSLLDSKQYELVIKITKDSKDSKDLFYLISAYTCLGRYVEALDVIDKNKEILATKLAALIPIHIELLCALKKFDLARETLKEYEEYPYESQVVEETLVKMKDVIIHNEKMKEGTYYSEDFIIEKLGSKKDEDLIFALDLLRSRDVLYFLPYIKEILVKFPNKMIRSLTLMLLVEKEVDREVKFLNFDKLITVNPKHLNPPFTGANFNEIVKDVDRKYKNLTIQNISAQLLSRYAIYIYPNEVEKDVAELSLAIYIEASNLLGDPIPVSKIVEMANSNNLDVEKVTYYLARIKEANQ